MTSVSNVWALMVNMSYDNLVINTTTTTDYPMFNGQQIDYINDTLTTNSSGATTYVPYESRPETYIVPAVFLMIFIVGLLGNGTVVYIYFRSKSMRTVPNTYIISLGIGDLIIIVVALPFVSTIYTFESWPYGELVCKLSEFARDISFGVTVFTLTILSAERYAAIITPMKYISNQNKTIAINLIIWVLSILIALPSAYNSFVWEVYISDNKSIKVCYPFPDDLGDMYPKIVVIFKFLFYYAIPLIMIASFYTLMARHLIKSAKNPIGQNPTQYRQLKGRKKISKIVLGLVVMFAICFFPNHIFMLWYYFHPHANELYNNFWHFWRIIGFVLSFLNSCLNPIVLFIISGVFRSHFKHHILWCFYGDPTHKHQPTLLGLRSANTASIDSANTAKLSKTPITYV